MTELIMKLCKCAEELTQIADAMAKQVVKSEAVDQEEIERRLGDDAKRIIVGLGVLGITVDDVKLHQGPALNKIELSIPSGCSYDSVAEFIKKLFDSRWKRSGRIEAPIPGRETIGIEYAREDPEPVAFADTVLLELSRLDANRRRPNLPVVVGKTAENKIVSFDLSTMPHLLIGGDAGQGKTVFIHNLINGLISTRSPAEVRLIVFDFEARKYSAYKNLPHLLIPVISDSNEAITALSWAVHEMEKRLRIFTCAKVRNINDFNHRDIASDDPFEEIPETVPYIVVVLGGLSELMLACGEYIVPNISRLAAKARATGIHLVLATRQTDDSVVSASIKANIPGRIAFKVATEKDSQNLLEDLGAERLNGNGDCLYKNESGLLGRAQTPYISKEQIAYNVERAIAMYPSEEYKWSEREIFRSIRDPFAGDSDETML